MLAFDPTVHTGQTGTPYVGPNWQLGATSGVDITDPTYSAGPPASYGFDADAFITFGDVLDTTFASATGFSIIAAINYAVGDNGVFREIIGKRDATHNQFYVAVGAGTEYQIFTFYADNAGRFDGHTFVGAFANGNRVVGANYDPTQARASRHKLYVAGSLLASTTATAGLDGTVSDTVAALKIGNAAAQGVSTIGPVYIYNRPLVSSEHANNATWLIGNKGWA